jgi:RNA polymerase sigma factor (sigma-70 family)
MTDVHLLRQFVQAGDQDAFRQIVDRHIDMVHAAAFRQISDATMAEDVTQAVFIVLARKAKRVNGATLAGWLVNSARLIAMDARRNEVRRRVREQKAASMKPESYSPKEWEQIGPLLDEALSKLREKDRAVVTLRYLEGRGIPEVATAMGISEAAVSKRLTRSLVKLRNRFSRKGLDLPIDIVATVFLASPHLSAPAGLAGQALSAAMGHGAAVGAATAAVGLAHTAIASMKTAAIMIWTAVATAVAVSTSVVGFEAVRYSRPAAAPVGSVAVESTAATTPGTGKIMVGIFLSYQTANGSHYGPTSLGGKAHLVITRAIHSDPVADKEMELIPIIEPGTATTQDIRESLGSTFKTESPVDGSDVEALMNLDVIICPRVWSESPEVLSAVDSAVRRGKGLMNFSGVGQIAPGPGVEVVDRLNGVAAGQGAYVGYPKEVECEVIASHPILGTLTKGELVNIAGNGQSGPLGSGTVGLIRVKNPSRANPIPIEAAQAQVMENTEIATTQGSDVRMALPPAESNGDTSVFTTLTALPANYVFYPITITTLGKGTIVNCNFLSVQAVPTDLQNATNQKFLKRSIEWLAGRPLN